MQPVLSRTQIRAYDRHAIEHCSVPGVVLMENAGRGAAEMLLRRFRDVLDGAPVVLVCGRGNNGGDGFVVARHLLTAGVSVEVFVMPPRQQVEGDARINLDAYLGIGGLVWDIAEDAALLKRRLAAAAVVVDALLGTGINREVQGLWAAVITLINEAKAPVVALDIPSGIDADSGQVHRVAVNAACTMTFGAYKCGLLQGEALRHRGELELVGLGVPVAPIVAAVGSCAHVFGTPLLKRLIAPRAVDSHKYRAGSVLVIAGSEGKIGAALLCAEAALRAGAGMATIASWPDAVAAMQGMVREVMTYALSPEVMTPDALAASLGEALKKRAAVAIGPGLGLDVRARQVCEWVALQHAGPVVLDADAISHFAGRAELLKTAAGARVLTPHSGELARLLGSTSAAIEADRFAAVKHAAKLTGATVLLKGAHTLVAQPDGTTGVCMAGTPLLGTAGSGDVLTGIVAALLCDHAPSEAARGACQWHALAAASWREQVGADRGMLAGDISAQLPAALSALTR